MAKQRHIVAIGGGGWVEGNSLFEEYIFKLAGKKRPKILFVPTASAESESYVRLFYRFFRKRECEPDHLSLFKGKTADLKSVILQQDIIYVGGGNTRNLLVLWREWGLDKLMLQAWKKGIVLCGVSAGAICWFEEGVTDSIPGTLTRLKCLGFLPGSACPHYDGEVNRRPCFHRLLQKKDIGPGVAIEDGAALHFVGRKLHRVVSSVPEKKAFKLKLNHGKAEEDLLEATYLGLSS